MAAAAGDSKYFSTTKKGEVAELKAELASQDRAKKVDGVKKVIAAMTVGKDVSSLFPYVINCMQTTHLELKKLVYLYLMNYARTQPDMAIMSVNTFINDAGDPNPLVRALAVRTMGCIRVDKITEYLCEPLRRALKDADPYVRKTAAVCVAKLYDINPELADDQGFIEDLHGLLGDSNPMVVANSVASLSEIAQIGGTDLFQLNTSLMNKLLAALNECTEWGQAYILAAIVRFEPGSAHEAESICERVTPRLSHANSAVALNAIKVLLKLMDHCSAEFNRGLSKKMAPPLVTLLSAPPEIQYVALRNIDLVVQKRPSILAHEIRVFFCKYYDPVYVKLEKLEIMIKLCQDRNVDQVLAEFKEYAQEVDVDFVRRSIRAIGRVAIKLESSAERCIKVLLDLIETKVNYVVQEVIIVIKDIFRRYPNKYETIISKLCDSLETLDEPEAKASMIWIIGEYADRIDNADMLLDSFLDGFVDEPAQVQLQLLTGIVKLFLKRPNDTQKMVQKVLELGTQETDNPDLRDRAYLYWRLLSNDPEAAKQVVLAAKPLISDQTNQLEPTLLNELCSYISTVAAVFHRPPETFVSKLKTAVRTVQPASLPSGAANTPMPTEQPAAKETSTAPIGNLLDLDLDMPSAAPAAAADAAAGNGAAQQPVRKTVVLTSEAGNGLQIAAAFQRRNGQVSLEMTLTNTTNAMMGATAADFAIQFNKNSYGLTPSAALQVSVPIKPGDSVDTSLPCSQGGATAEGPVSPAIQMAVKSPVGVFYFADNVPLHVVFTEDGLLERNAFLESWRSIPDANESIKHISDIPVEDVEAVRASLAKHNVFFIVRRNVDGQDVVYMSCKALGTPILVELTFRPGTYSCKVCSKTSRPELTPLFEHAIDLLLRNN